MSYLAAAAAHALELVLDARSGGQLEREVPEVGAVEPPDRLRCRQAEPPVPQVHRVGLAAMNEGDRRALEPGARAIVTGVAGSAGTDSPCEAKHLAAVLRDQLATNTRPGVPRVCVSVGRETT